MTNAQPTPTRRHPVRTTVAAATAIGSAGLAAFLALGGSAQAHDTLPGRADAPGITAGPSFLSDLTVSTGISATFAPFTLPTIPPLTLLTIPPFTLLTVPTTTATDTLETTTTVLTPTTTTTTSTDTMPTTVLATTPGPVAGPGVTTGDQIPPFLEITSASVDCTGGLHVSYETGGNPEPAPTVNHILLTNPLSNPTGFTVQETQGQPVTGTFIVALQAPTPEPYRVFVTADFLPDDPNAMVLADQADALLDPGCPSAPTTVSG